MEKPHVLVVDDDASVRSFLFTILDRSGYRVSAAGDGVDALDILANDPPSVTIVDLKMPRMDGREYIGRVFETDPDSVILVLTGHGTVESAVDLMRSGVYSILTKPCTVDELLLMVEKALRERGLKDKSRDLERRLEVTERLAMIGKLAAGVAHELNSPLDGVMRFVKLTRDALPPDSETWEFQDHALSGLKRMSSIVRDLLTFSRNIALEVEEEGLEKQLREAATQVRANAPAGEFTIEFDLAVPDVTVPRGMFQVFQNLLKNAVDAIPPGGRVLVHAGIRNGEVFVSVRDDGCGIPPEAMDRVFEPFFTTKDVGKGTGLGLSIVSRIMERFGGGVDIQSEVGKGTDVTVFLPSGSSRSRDRREEEADAESIRTDR